MTKPTRADAELALKTLLEYIGEDPSREGLLETPKRVIKSYDELFSGYREDPEQILNKKFFDSSGYDEIIELQTIEFYSTCEHHMLPIKGEVAIAYIPDKAIIGISKLARLVDIFAKRLQIQEKMTVEIAISLMNYLKPKAVAVRIDAEHSCMTLRGVNKQNSIMTTKHYTGSFRDDETLKHKLSF